MDSDISSGDSSNPIQKNTKASSAILNSQVAVNALVMVASEIGSIYAIVHSADHESDIYRKTIKIQKDINKIAYNAQRGLLNLTEIEKSAADIEGLSTFIILKKTLNPLISDELVVMITTCAIDTNHALALTRIALK